MAELTPGIIEAIGEVERDNGERCFTVSTSHGIFRASTALSCLVHPHCGDKVLVACRSDATFILAVLERQTDSPTELRLKGEISLEVEGTLAIRTSEMLRLDGGKQLQGGANSVTLSGQHIAINGEHVSLVSRAVNWVADTLETTARIIRQTGEIWSVHAKTHHRRIEGLELVQAESLDLKARDLLNINTTHVLVKSQELVKVDAKQIQMG